MANTANGSSALSPEPANRAIPGDGGPATQALLNNPFDLAFDPGVGSLCFSDTYNHCIRRIDARTGAISTIAGNGESGFSGDGGPSTKSADEPAVRNCHRPRRQKYLRGRQAERTRAADRRRYRGHQHVGGRRFREIQR